MPTYEYTCRECGEHLEVVQSFRDEPLTECPACAGALRKVFGNIGITFKGSGFYKTDSRAASSGSKKSGSSSASAESGSSTSSGSKAESKSDSKTSSETKSETKSSSSEKKAAAS